MYSILEVTPFYFKPCYLKTYSPLDTILRQQPIHSYASQILDLGTVAGLPHGSWLVSIYTYTNMYMHV